MTERCQICNITSDGRYSSYPFPTPKSLKFFISGNLLVCSACEFPSSSKDELEDGEIELIDGDWDL